MVYILEYWSWVGLIREAVSQRSFHSTHNVVLAILVILKQFSAGDHVLISTRVVFAIAGWSFGLTIWKCFFMDKDMSNTYVVKYFKKIPNYNFELAELTL